MPTSTLHARLPLRIERKLAEYCAKQGINRFEAVVRALDAFLENEASGANAYALAADLIPERGVTTLQSEKVRKCAAKAFGVG